MIRKRISNWILKLWGFEIIRNYTEWPKKNIVAVVPHTSSWDFPLGLLVRASLRRDIKFVGKASLFRFPFGMIFKALGGYPVDRSKSNNFTDAVVSIFNRKDAFSICLAPEGTRRRVEKLKTGFYYIAKGAGVPILLCQFDWKHRKVVFSAPFWPTEDMEADFEFITSYFRGVIGKVPEYSF